MKCNACKGTRVTSQLVAETKRSNGLDYRTGRMVERLHQCEACKGTGRQLQPEPTPPAGYVEIAGGLVEAPGFTAETFSAGIAKARKVGTMNIAPASTPGAVLVTSARTGARYMVTRAECSCPGHAGQGHCYHRAAAILIADLFGVDLCHTEVLGFDPAGYPVTAADRAHQLQEVA